MPSHTASRLSIILAASLLAACGGTTAERAGLAPTSVVQGTPATAQTQWRPAEYRAADDTILASPRITPTAARTTLSRNTSPGFVMPQNFRAYAFGFQVQGTRGVTPGGAGTTYALQVLNEGMERGHARIGETELPTRGTANFFGTYAGAVGNLDSSFQHDSLIRGNVSLTADFGAGTVTGTIGDRIDNSARNADPLTLTSSLIDARDGSFGGATSGGVLSDRGYTLATGSYDGLIVGDDGQEVVGGVTLRHSRAGGPTLIEVGGFVAAR